jgi:hypothetical protein
MFPSIVTSCATIEGDEFGMLRTPFDECLGRLKIILFCQMLLESTFASFTRVCWNDYDLRGFSTVYFSLSVTACHGCFRDRDHLG